MKKLYARGKAVIATTPQLEYPRASLSEVMIHYFISSIWRPCDVKAAPGIPVLGLENTFESFSQSAG